MPWLAVSLFMRAPKIRVNNRIAASMNTTMRIQNVALLGLCMNNCRPTEKSSSPPRKRNRNSCGLFLMMSWFTGCVRVAPIKV